ncbi:MAG TPA: maleylacetoacetate isomerase [Rhodanobacter sp.]|nr:maleylacetoacetate isomerase [Rhodanobacter sp.]
MATDLMLYDYWRSSASYRVRIALNLKGLPYASHSVHLVQDGGQQHAPAYLALNPQQLVPSLVDGDLVLTQSLAIMEYAEEKWPAPPLLPADREGRARVRALALAVACDVHPLGNLRVLQYLQGELGVDDERRKEWSRHWIATGFAALEAMLAGDVATGRFCHGDTPGMADACLVPQVYNARRWHLPMDAYPTITRIDQACSTLEAFRSASPDTQPGAA